MCDTIVATKEATGDGSVILAKNSDREPNEAQYVEYHPARSHKAGEDLKVTYLTIPQAEQTRAVLLSRPFWMWGAEMGANDAGVVIGNEAVFTKLPMRSEKLLLGMDLLRLALERSAGAGEALEVITELLTRYGQGGPAGYEDKKLAYHNSFIIADPKEAWVLETADRQWAAKRISGVYSISNGLTIGGGFDKASPALVSTAVQKGWTKSESDFEFARDYSDWFFTTFSMCRPRAARTTEIVSGRRGSVDSRSMMELLRDHRGEGTSYEPHRGLFMNKVCMHAANGLSRASQTTGSLVCHLGGDINTHWITGTAAPCTSIFKPFFFEAGGLPDVGPEPTGRYDQKSLWWRHERLHRALLMDYPTRIALVEKERNELERRFIAQAQKTVAEALKLTADQQKKRLAAFSRECFAQAEEAESRWTEAVVKMAIAKRPSAGFRSYWKKQNKKAGLNL
ncbi:MAG: C69 family dipeptidase [Deltaproteobacteria bacterium]|nr:C69 family dipeptidase [Candidatus Zymogenaceae bacterium]